MDMSTHSMNSLFDQLGLPSSDDDIETFVGKHRPLPPSVRLAEADFWDDSQAAFLREAVKQDADWAEVVDDLNARLRD